MKKYLSFFIILAIAFFIGTQALHAEDNNSSGSISGDARLKADMDNNRGDDNQNDNSSRGNWRDKIVEFRNNIKGEKDTIKARQEEGRISTREKFMDRFEAAVSRIDNLDARVLEQINKLEAKGVVTTDAKSSEAKASLKLSAAKTNIAEINALLSISITELTKEQRTRLVTLAKDTQGLLSDAHSLLKDAIKSLKNSLKVKLDAETKSETN